MTLSSPAEPSPTDPALPKPVSAGAATPQAIAEAVATVASPATVAAARSKIGSLIAGAAQMSPVEVLTGKPKPTGQGQPAPIPAPPAEAAMAPARPDLTDVLDIPTLQQIQDSFTALTRFSTTIRDAAGNPVTRPSDMASLARSDRVLEFLIAGDVAAENKAGFVAPIVVNDEVLGSITIEAPTDGQGKIPVASRGNFEKLTQALGLPAERAAEVIGIVEREVAPSRAASLQFLYLLANSIARLCYKDFELGKRVEELSALYRMSTVLAGHRNLQHVMDTAVQTAAEVMNVKAVSIRLLDDAGRSLMPRATCGLTDKYLHKGPINPERSEIFKQALAGQVVVVEDIPSDPRVLYPQYARDEGLASMLVAGMQFQGRPIGTVQVFTGEKRRFTRYEKDLLNAMSQLLAAAIQHAKLDAMRRAAEQIQHQVRLAADVQKRMLPRGTPNVPPLDIAARYVPSAQLGGDFYDFIPLNGNLGVCVGDVVGKGVAASLLMASVRASLRAYTQDVYDLDEIIARVNVALSRDTRDNEFATLFYGVIDPTTRRMTYCNAGHEPTLLLRDGQFHVLDTGGMIVGIDPDQKYEKGVIDLKAGDMLLLYSDGLCDAQNFERQRFGRQRIKDAMLAARETTTAHDALSHVLWEMRRFAGLNDRTDDTTLVMIRVK